ncbi:MULTISPECIES: IS4 family transposase [unclassified Pseudomonas]|uniref:IS4 family transposase n=1 Tax=unclassified Pseudomonas TaxID=196821 RepID=UPI000BA4BE3C|nr:MULTISPECIES: IS4 family transposase [unclassified Pseudomonas]
MFSSTRLGQLLSAIPRPYFQQSIETHRADHYVKRCTSWQLLVTLISGHLTQALSLRSLATFSETLAAHSYHLQAGPIARSTLSDALNKRDYRPFQDLCELLLRGVSHQQRKAVGAMVSLIDSTSITLRGPHFDDWTAATKTRITQGLKVHVGLDLAQLAPVYVNITHANVNDLSDALDMPIQAGMTYVFDKGYCDYNWWHQLQTKGALFVTRLKKNANIKVLHEHSNVAEHSVVMTDEVIRFGKKHLGGKRLNDYWEEPVRRVVVAREGHATPLILVTNDFARTAEEIADLYKDRWKIELFFKWIKQHLKLKRFYAFSENAVRLQIYSALISYLLLHLFQRRSGFPGSLFELTVRIAHVLHERPATQEFKDRRRQEREKLKAAQGSLQL